MARLYANENFPLPVVEELRRLGHDVLTIHETRRAGQQVPDDEVLASATADGRAVLTLNRRHFITLTPLAGRMAESLRARSTSISSVRPSASTTKSARSHVLGID